MHFEALEHARAGSSGQRRWRGPLVALATLAGLAILSLALAVALMWLHQRNLPSFDSYVRAVRAEPSRATPAATEVLADGGGWTLGDEDPFAREKGQIEGFDVEVSIAHGADALLELEQSVAYTFEGDAGERSALALRTARLETSENMRARVRLYLEDADQLVGPGSARRGKITWDVLLLAGAGASEVQVVRAKPEAADLLTSSLTPSIWELLSRSLDPSPELPREGLVHHVRSDVYLTAAPTENGWQGLSFGAPEHGVSTEDYSYSLRVRFETFGPGGGGSAHETKKSRSFTWNGKTL